MLRDTQQIKNFAVEATDDGVNRGERERELAADLQAESARHRNDDPHLRSCNAVAGYHLSATDGEVGHVAGYLVDEHTWAIRYLIVDTSNWWMGHEVLLAPGWITGVHWSGKTVAVDLSREAVKAAPVYDPATEWSRQMKNPWLLGNPVTSCSRTVSLCRCDGSVNLGWVIDVLPAFPAFPAFLAFVKPRRNACRLPISSGGRCLQVCGTTSRPSVR